MEIIVIHRTCRNLPRCADRKNGGGGGERGEGTDPLARRRTSFGMALSALSG